MNYFLALIGVFAAILAVYTLFTLWSRKETMVRSLALAGFFVFPWLVPAFGTLTLGYPKSTFLEKFDPAMTTGDKMLVLGIKLIEGQGIYIMVDRGEKEPKLYGLPWDQKMAEQLQDAMNEGDENGGIVMEFNFDWDWFPPNPQFETLPPQKALPDKPMESKPRVYERSA